MELSQSILRKLKKTWSMSKRNPLLLLEDILHACQKIQEYTQTLTFEQFEKNEMIIDAVIWNFKIIGEAANKLPDEFKDAYTEIDWHRIRGFRNRIVHDYFGVDLAILWKIKIENIPVLVVQIQTILDG